MDIELLVWFFTIVGGAVATLLLIRPTISAVKWLLPPRLDVDFADYSRGNIKKDCPKEITVTPNKPIEVGIRILPKWTHKLRIIEVLRPRVGDNRNKNFCKETPIMGERFPLRRLQNSVT